MYVKIRNMARKIDSHICNLHVSTQETNFVLPKMNCILLIQCLLVDQSIVWYKAENFV